MESDMRPVDSIACLFWAQFVDVNLNCTAQKVRFKRQKCRIGQQIVEIKLHIQFYSGTLIRSSTISCLCVPKTSNPTIVVMKSAKDGA
jgi:hypothetical protein